VEVEDLTKHKMDSEQIIISPKAADIVNDAKKNRKKVCAIGTTSIRAIETSVSTNGMLKPYDGWTNKFIYPPYDFSVADCLVTNFHTPMSTLLMMISAFCGHDLMMEGYKQAVENKYRFYSYGDAMLIL
jgi:S-adenosylmethionine:tRNA ribosyltransferase-isomerase